MRLNENFKLTESKYNKLLEKIKNLNINLEDIEEHFTTGSGKGGQKINKTSNAVHLKYIPLGIEVKYQKTRERSINRILALRELVDKIEFKLLGTKSEKAMEMAKIRKQKKRRHRRAINDE